MNYMVKKTHQIVNLVKNVDHFHGSYRLLLNRDIIPELQVSQILGIASDSFLVFERGKSDWHLVKR